MKSYTIHLIRHGVSEGNLLGQYIGVTDSPLSRQGKEQLLQRKEAGGYPQAQAYFTSPLSRCVDTLELLYPGAKPVVVEAFRECDFGDWEGKSAKDLEQDPAFLRWMEQGGDMAPPHGESGGAFMQRTCLAFEKLVQDLLKSGTASAVIVGHGGTLMSILSAYGLPRAKFYDWMTEPGTGYSLRITPGLWMRSMVAEVYGTIPPRAEEAPQSNVINLAREAADRAWGGEGEKG